MVVLDQYEKHPFKPELETLGSHVVQRYGIYFVLISFSSLYYLSNASIMLGHYDLGWHLAAGDLIRDQGGIPFQDPWSFTLGNRQWYNLSWLWDVIASVVYQYAKLDGLVLCTLACGAIIVGYLASVCLSRGASAAAVCVSVFSACLLYPSFATPPNVYLAASPNTATMLFSVLFYGQCLKRTRYFLLPVMMVAWVNLHGGFLLGFLIIGAFGGVALLRRDWKAAKMLALVGISCFAAMFVNPLGWNIFEGVTATLGNFVQANITEWQSYYSNMSMPGSVPGILYALVFAVFELRLNGLGSIPLEARLLSWLFLGLGIYQFRYTSFFFLFSTVPMALHLDRLWRDRFNDLEIRKSMAAAGVVGMCVLPLVFVKMESAFALPAMLSQKDAAYLQAHFSHARLLNHWNVGGLLIFRTRGAVPVFVDGRAATAYPDDLLRDYFSLVHQEIDERAWDSVLEKYRIDAVLWVKDHEQLRRFLVDKRGWKEEYAGAYESVYVKP